MVSGIACESLKLGEEGLLLCRKALTVIYCTCVKDGHFRPGYSDMIYDKYSETNLKT